MRALSRVLIDESHRQAWTSDPARAQRMNPVNPADASLAAAVDAAVQAGMDVRAHTEGPIDDQLLGEVDVLVIPHMADDTWEHTTGTGSPWLSDAEISAVEAFVRDGGGLIVLAETEQPKYGNNLADLAARFGVTIENTTVQDPANCFHEVPTWVLAEMQRGTRHDLAARVHSAAFYRSGSLSATGDVFARTSPSADPAGAPLGVAVQHAAGRVVVTADSDLFGDDSIDDLDNRNLWLNLLFWAAGARPEATATTPGIEPWPHTSAAWQDLAAAVEQVRIQQNQDGSIDDPAGAQEAIGKICAAVEQLADHFPHQKEHLTATLADLRAWADGGFGVPDFSASLTKFRPDLHRRDGVEHLVVFPMYTQNGNPNRNLEALVIRTFWPQWLADQEQTYRNPAFVPIEFVAFTSGYQSHSAVLFPETVASANQIDFSWGGIFCDREAARFRTIGRAAAEQLGLSLPPDLDMLLNDQRLAQETFVLWDLIHDRTHGRGDLPFDPFMIKQRMPYWMYALEELRCDLATYRETLRLDTYLSRFIRYAITVDRLFRFPITGKRVRNYDGLGGQIIFAWLHRSGVLQWTDNTLRIDWSGLDEAMVALCDEVEELYRCGIDRSRIGQWLASHEFVASLVPPNPASVWGRGVDALPVNGERKDLVNAVLPDEFPLNVFYEALQRRLETVVEQTAGITPWAGDSRMAC